MLPRNILGGFFRSTKRVVPHKNSTAIYGRHREELLPMMVGVQKWPSMAGNGQKLPEGAPQRGRIGHFRDIDINLTFGVLTGFFRSDSDVLYTVRKLSV